MSSSALFIGLAFIIVISPIVSNLTRLPTVVVEIILGALAVWFGLLDTDNDTFKKLSKIGFFYLMFLAGLEIDLRRFAAQKSTLIEHAIVYYITIYALSFGLYFFLDLNPIYIIAIPIISIGMIMALINEQGRAYQWLETLLIVGVMGEILSISAMVIFESYIHYGVSVALYKNIAIFFLVLLSIYYSFKILNILFWWFPELKRLIMPENDAKVQSVRVSAAIFIILISIMYILHIDMVLGAFFAGIYIANFFEHKKDLPHLLHKVGFGFLVPLFFIYVGTTLDLNVVLSFAIINHALLIVLAIVGVRIVGAFVAYSTKFGIKETFLLALGDSMPLTFIIAVATLSFEAKLISQNEYLAFVLAAMFTGIFMMSLLKFLITVFYKTKIR